MLATVSIVGTCVAPEDVIDVTDQIAFEATNEIAHADLTEGSFIESREVV